MPSEPALKLAAIMPDRNQCHDADMPIAARLLPASYNTAAIGFNADS